MGLLWTASAHCWNICEDFLSLWCILALKSKLAEPKWLPKLRIRHIKNFCSLHQVCPSTSLCWNRTVALCMGQRVWCRMSSATFSICNWWFSECSYVRIYQRCSEDPVILWKRSLLDILGISEEDQRTEDQLALKLHRWQRAISEYHLSACMNLSQLLRIHPHCRESYVPFEFTSGVKNETLFTWTDDRDTPLHLVYPTTQRDW